MQFKMYKPTKELSHIVRQYVVIYNIKKIESMLFLPNGGNFLIFNRGIVGCVELHTGEKYEIPQAYSIGMKINKAKQLRDCYLNSTSIVFPIILVDLMPIGFYKLFNKDASILAQEYVIMEHDIVQKYFSNLYSHSNIKEEINYLNLSLNKMNISNNNTRIWIEDVLDRIVNHYNFEVNIEDLTSEFKCTRKMMERQFKKFIGLTPKTFIYVAKFCKTFLEYIKEGKTFKEIEYLYSDNAHLNVVFKNITGYSPREIFNEVVKDNNIQIYQIHKKGIQDIHIINNILKKYSLYILDDKNHIIKQISNINSQSTLREFIAIAIELDEQNIKYEINHNGIQL